MEKIYVWIGDVMENKILIKVLSCLEKYKEKPVAIRQKGFVSSEFIIKKLFLNFDNDILCLKDESDKTYISININQIYKIEELEKSSNLFLDNDMQLEILLF